MADDSEETLDDRLDRLQRRAENFRELLRDGDEVTIAFQDGEMVVAESFRSQLERKHPKLFGRMLAIEAQMNAGWAPYAAALALSGFFLFGLPLGWWLPLLGDAVVAQMESWWFYTVLPAGMLYLAHLTCGRWESYVYRRNRGDLLEMVAAEKLDRDILLVMLRDEDGLDAVVYQWKLDAGPFPDNSALG